MFGFFVAKKIWITQASNLEITKKNMATLRMDPSGEKEEEDSARSESGDSL